MRTPLLTLAIVLVACGGNGGGDSGQGPSRAALHNGAPAVRVVVSTTAPPEVREAAAEIAHALSEITGQEFAAPSTNPKGPEPILIVVGSGLLDDGTAVSEGLGVETYRIGTHRDSKRWIVEIRGGGPVALQYGAYDLCQRFGVRYFHPEETFYPRDEEFELPLPVDAYEAPDLMVRGIHHHTRHPIPYADFLLAGDEANRPYLDRWLLWMVRNRLNLHELELLDTVDLAAWVPYITKYINKAHGYGVAVGVSLSFADERERAYRLIREKGPTTPQIAAGLDAVLAAPFDHVVLQSGGVLPAAPDLTSAWTDDALAHLALAHPGVEAYTAAPSGTAGLTLAARLLDTVDGAAAASESGKRTLVYAPETSHWMSFDLDVPLALPSVGQARQEDLVLRLKEVQLLGAVADSTGQEWGGWMWDLAASRYAWDRTLTFEAYLSWLHPLIGAYDEVLRKLAEDQRTAFTDRPQLVAYLTGERPSNEAPSPFGPPDRPRRTLLRDVVAMDAAAFAAWQASDLAPLTEMRERVAKRLEPIGEPKAPQSAEDDNASERAHREIDALLRLYIARLDLVLATYAAAAKLRETGEEAKAALDGLLQTVEDAKRDGEKRIAEAEKLYRIPKELLYGERANPTIWPAGYLQRTHDAYYWVRRSDELEALIDVKRGNAAGKWAAPPTAVYRGSVTAVLTPANPVAQAALQALLPDLLVGVHAWQSGLQSKVDVSLATDRDRNGVPDAGSVVRVSDGANIGPFESQIIAESFRLPFADATETALGELLVAPCKLAFEPTYEAGALAGVASATLTGTMDAEKLRALLLALSDGALDAASSSAIATQVFGASSVELKLTLGPFTKL